MSTTTARRRALKTTRTTWAVGTARTTGTTRTQP